MLENSRRKKQLKRSEFCNNIHGSWFCRFLLLFPVSLFGRSTKIVFLHSSLLNCQHCPRFCVAGLSWFKRADDFFLLLLYVELSRSPPSPLENGGCLDWQSKYVSASRDKALLNFGFSLLEWGFFLYDKSGVLLLFLLLWVGGYFSKTLSRISERKERDRFLTFLKNSFSKRKSSADESGMCLERRHFKLNFYFQAIRI